MFTIDVKGLSELEQALTQLPVEIAQKELTKALAAGAEVIAEEMRLEAPEESGEDRRRIAVLKEHIVVQAENKVIGSAAEVYVGPDTVVAYRARWMELGTTAHAIVTKLTRKMMRAGTARKEVLASKEAIFGPQANHPGDRPRPFMRPALQVATPKAVEAIRKALADGIQRAAKRVARKTI